MLRCYRARKLIASYLYGELDEGRSTALESHLGKCPRCAREAASRKEALQLVDRVKTEVEYPERFEELFPTMVRGRVELGDVEPSFSRRPRTAFAVRQTAYAFCTLLLGILVGSSAMLVGGLRSAHYTGLVQDARQLRAVREAIDNERVLDMLGALKVQLAAEGKANLLARLSAFESEALDIMPLSDEEKHARYLAQSGDAEVVAGNFTKASAAYSTLLERYPESIPAPNARRMVAFIAKEKLGDYPEAIRQYEAELARADLQETTERALFDLAETCLQMGEYENAARSYSLLQERFPTGTHVAESMFKLADVYFDRLRDFEAARETYYLLAVDYADDIDRLGAQPTVQTRLAMLDQSARYGYKPVQLFLDASGRGGGRAFELYEKLIHRYPYTTVASLALDEMSLIEWYGEEFAPVASMDALSEEQRVEALRKVIGRCNRKDVAAFAHMAIGDIFRDQIKDLGSAQREYQLVLDSYPESLRASEAQSRINKLVLASASGRGSQS
jgi:outer membrane protein assembly factor BamD (BamD/ComL family)